MGLFLRRAVYTYSLGERRYYRHKGRVTEERYLSSNFSVWEIILYIIIFSIVKVIFPYWNKKKKLCNQKIISKIYSSNVEGWLPWYCVCGGRRGGCVCAVKKSLRACIIPLKPFANHKKKNMLFIKKNIFVK